MSYECQYAELVDNKYGPSQGGDLCHICRGFFLSYPPTYQSILNLQIPNKFPLKELAQFLKVFVLLQGLKEIHYHQYEWNSNDGKEYRPQIDHRELAVVP